MRINQKIYRAIQKGLNEALANLSIDDFDFNDTTITNDNLETIESFSGTKEHENWKWIKENFVDLGLPSGNLWAKYNLGANSENNPGNYYAWGDPYQKESCSITNYTYHDDPVTLPLSHDAAYQMYHEYSKHIHIPTKEQFEELIKYTTYTWYNDKGIRFTGKNGNSIFIPVGGFMHDTEILGDTQGYIWTSSSGDKGNTWYLIFSNYCCIGEYNVDNAFGDGTRYFGINIRPILSKQ